MSAEKPEGGNTASNRSVLQQHVDFFDTDHDGKSGLDLAFMLGPSTLPGHLDLEMASSLMYSHSSHGMYVSKHICCMGARMLYLLCRTHLSH